MTDHETIRKQCWDRAFYAFGTSRVFAKRAERLRTLRTWLVFLGIALPLVVGGTVLAFSTTAAALRFLLPIAGVLSVLQLTISAWSLVSRWDERYEASLDSSQNNYELFSRYEALAKYPPIDIESKFEPLEERNKAQERVDTKTDMTPYERRYAMRHSLIQFKRSCATCKQEPKSMSEYSNCDLCGNLEKKLWTKLKG